MVLQISKSFKSPPNIAEKIGTLLYFWGVEEKNEEVRPFQTKTRQRFVVHFTSLLVTIFSSCVCKLSQILLKYCPSPLF